MSYDLKVRGVSDFRLSVDRLAKQVRDPLEGTVGGNTVFRARFSPVSSTPTPIVYTSGSVAAGEYTLDGDTGTVVFDSAPSVQPTMTYSWSNMTDEHVVDILVAAFHEMEGRWPRRFKLADSTGAEVVYPSDSDEVNVVDSAGDDPTCGSDTFSTSAVERHLLMACARYTHLVQKLDEAAERTFMFREDRGVTVDKSRVPQNLDLAVARSDNNVKQALRSAQAKYYSGSNLGSAMKQPGTMDYFADYEWQTDSRDQDYRLTNAGQ